MANEEKCIIRSIITPTIRLDRISDEDFATGTSPQGQPGPKTSQSHTAALGVAYPIVVIGSYRPGPEELVMCNLSYEDFMPRIYLEIAPQFGRSKSVSLPKDGDLVSIFIRGKNNAFKPIRNDFIITSVYSTAGTNEGMGGTMHISGELFIPRIKDERVKAIKGTSILTLQEICRELGLGFATNESETSDEQTWICTGDSYENFIQHITTHSWKNDRSFYTCYIDAYYHLNFINVNNQVEGDGKLETAIIDQGSIGDVFSSDFVAQTESATQQTFPKMLSDIEAFSGSNMYVFQFAPMNNSSQISAKWGYKSFAQFFDQASEKMWEIFVDPITSEGAEDNKVLLKGRPLQKDSAGQQETYWKTQNKRYWLGIQYKDVHDKYLYAELWNNRNNAELQKLYIEASIFQWNPNIYRGEKIPLLMHISADLINRQENVRGPEESRDQNTPGAVTNNFYSGYYMVHSFQINYSLFNNPGPVVSVMPSAADTANSPTIKQIFTLTRREWPVPQGQAGQIPPGT